jgi:hypothetical protein
MTTRWFALALCLSACHAAHGRDLSVAQLSDVVAREQPSLDHCYQDSLDQAPYEHEFRIEATLHIEPDGHVAKVQLDQAGLPGIGPCLQKEIKAWRFPSAPAPTDTKLPIIFRPKVVKDLPKLPPGFQVLQPPQ